MVVSEQFYFLVWALRLIGEDMLLCKCFGWWVGGWRKVRIDWLMDGWILLISEPSLGLLFFVVDSVCLYICLSVCLFVTNITSSFLFLDGIEPFLGHQFSMTKATKHSSVFTVRRYALHGLSYRNSVRPSVRPSVCHTRALCPHGSTYDHDFFTIW